MAKKKNLFIIMIAALGISMFTGCSEKAEDTKKETTVIDSENTDTRSKDQIEENIKKTEDSINELNAPPTEYGMGKKELIQISEGEENTAKDYQIIYDSLQNFTDFVNKRTDYSDAQKRELISNMTKQFKLIDALHASYKNVLTEDEYDTYMKSPLEGHKPLDPNFNPNVTKRTSDEEAKHQEIVGKLKELQTSDPEISKLYKEFLDTKAGIQSEFEAKTDSEFKKLIGFN